ncbi:MAG: hypothetical protein IPL86_15570 [Flavobacteriales bacterium]|nr:hypothetical protein [Flavobacteriales bacterium]
MEPMKFHHAVPVELDGQYWLGLALVPLFWVGLFVVIGGYSDIFRRFRTKELGQTLLIAFIGSMMIFFALLLDDTVAAPKFYYRSFGALFGLNFALLFLFRFLLTSRTVNRVHDRRIGFNLRAVDRWQRTRYRHPCGDQRAAEIAWQPVRGFRERERR